MADLPLYTRILYEAGGVHTVLFYSLKNYGGGGNGCIGRGGVTVLVLNLMVSHGGRGLCDNGPCGSDCCSVGDGGHLW